MKKKKRVEIDRRKKLLNKESIWSFCLAYRSRPSHRSINENQSSAERRELSIKCQRSVHHPQDIQISNSPAEKTSVTFRRDTHRDSIKTRKSN